MIKRSFLRENNSSCWFSLQYSITQGYVSVPRWVWPELWGLKGWREWREGCSHSAPSTGGGACRQPVWPWRARGCTRQGPQSWSPGGNNHEKLFSSIRLIHAQWGAHLDNHRGRGYMYRYLVDTSYFVHSKWILPSLLLFFEVARLVQCCWAWPGRPWG